MRTTLHRLLRGLVLAVALTTASTVAHGQQWFGIPADVNWRPIVSQRPDTTIHLPDGWPGLFSSDPVVRCRATIRWARALAQPSADWILTGCPMLAEAIEWEDAPGSLLPYVEWTVEQKELLNDFFQRLLANEARLGLSCPSAATAVWSASRVYVTEDQAFSIYAAHVAHALYLEVTHRVPWSILTTPREELRILLASPSYFVRLSGKLPGAPPDLDPLRAFTLPQRIAVGDGLVCDPRVGYRFLSGAYSTGGENLIGATEEETLARITLWMSRDVGHGGPEELTLEHERQYSYLDKRLQRRAYSDFPGALMSAGCHSAASFVHDLAKSINIPVLAVQAYERPPEEWPPHTALRHQGLAYHWARKDMRIVWHADDLYLANAFAINFPIDADGRRLSDADARRLFFEANWVAPSVLTAHGFELYGPVVTFPSTGADWDYRFGEPVIGTWHSPGYQYAGYSWDKRFDLCSWRDFVQRGWAATLDVESQQAVNGPWLLSHPTASFGPHAEACAAAYGGIDAVRSVVSGWEAARGSNLYTVFRLDLLPRGLRDRIFF